MEYWQAAVDQVSQFADRIDSFRIPDFEDYPHVVIDIQETLDKLRAKVVTLQSKMSVGVQGNPEMFDNEESILLAQEQEESAERELKKLQEAETKRLLDDTSGS